MPHIMTITLPDGPDIEVNVTETIISVDRQFFNFEGLDRSSGEQVTVRIETTENFIDRKEQRVLTS